MEKSLKKQMEEILKGTEDVLLAEELESIVSDSIKGNKPLKVKLGL
ncbi:MAG: tyrosine--tRNA ligase, partial [Actinobacteria bacterium]|nr:tyrosine--tRNA ligase [Actinomycetota bacterium]